MTDPSLSTAGLPRGFVERLQAENPALFGNIESALLSAPSVAVRLNAAKGLQMEGRPVPWCAAGRYLEQRPVFTLDPALHQGRYYVQDASSMFIGMVARQAAAALGGGALRWLDACAAPGGKTTCVIDSLPPDSLVVANELVPQRAAALRENVIKWGNPGVIVTRGDSSAFSRMKGAFDVVAADVPCSGEGMMRKDADAVAQWSPGLIESCAERQRAIVTSLWEALKPGGFMVYSTCTFNRAENEDMLAFVASELGGEVVPVEGIDPAWGIAESQGGYRFVPGRVEGEGLFMALIRKPGIHRPFQRPRPAKPDRCPQRTWLRNDGAGLAITAAADRLNAFPAIHIPMLEAVTALKGMSVIHHGIVLGRTKGRDVIPDHSLALSTALRTEAFPCVELDHEAALSYLRCDAVSLPADTPRGHVLLTHRGAPLGFVKHLGNRSNTLYPRDWRILMR